MDGYHTVTTLRHSGTVAVSTCDCNHSQRRSDGV